MVNHERIKNIFRAKTPRSPRPTALPSGLLRALRVLARGRVLAAAERSKAALGDSCHSLFLCSLPPEQPSPPHSASLRACPEHRRTGRALQPKAGRLALWRCQRGGSPIASPPDRCPRPTQPGRPALSAGTPNAINAVFTPSLLCSCGFLCSLRPCSPGCLAFPRRNPATVPSAGSEPVLNRAKEQA